MIKCPTLIQQGPHKGDEYRSRPAELNAGARLQIGESGDEGRRGSGRGAITPRKRWSQAASSSRSSALASAASTWLNVAPLAAFCSWTRPPICTSFCFHTCENHRPRNLSTNGSRRREQIQGSGRGEHDLEAAGLDAVGDEEGGDAAEYPVGVRRRRRRLPLRRHRDLRFPTPYWDGSPPFSGF